MTEFTTKVSNQDSSETGLQLWFPYIHAVSPQEFENDAREFNKRVEDLDRRLVTILIQAFDDTPDVEHTFKVSASGTEVSLSSPSMFIRGQ